MGNVKNQAQMWLSGTDVLLCSLIPTWRGSAAENIPDASLKQAEQQNQQS